MSNTYQKNSRRAEPDPLPGEVAVPGQVIVSMAEIAESAKEGLLALAVGTGLQVMASMFDEDAAAVGVSRQSVHSWVARYLAVGLAGLADKSHRPAERNRSEGPHAGQCQASAGGRMSSITRHRTLASRIGASQRRGRSGGQRAAPAALQREDERR